MESGSANQKTQYQCCFCGQSITTEPPVTLTLSPKGCGPQTLTTHWQCFRSRLHDSVPTLDPVDYR